ncbi:unnamed protein product, partial [Larinioides sclopetarius]
MQETEHECFSFKGTTPALLLRAVPMGFYAFGGTVKAAP